MGSDVGPVRGTLSFPVRVHVVFRYSGNCCHPYVAALEHGKPFHSNVVYLEFVLDTFVGTLVIDMKGKVNHKEVFSAI